MSEPEVFETPLGCFDCGFAYGGVGWCDVIVPDNVWLRISPSGNEGGILCFNCICRRIERLGLERVPFVVRSGPLLIDHDAPVPWKATSIREQAVEDYFKLPSEEEQRHAIDRVTGKRASFED